MYFSEPLYLQTCSEAVQAVEIEKLSTVMAHKELLRVLRTCQAIIAPESDCDSFNFLVWEAVGFGTPVLLTNESGIACQVLDHLCYF